MNRPFGLQGHRGARGLFPENTLEGFQAAFALGVESFELDVGVTADNVVVVTHDLALNPDITRDAGGNWLVGTGPAVRDLTWDALRQYDVGRIRPGSRYAGLYPCQRACDGARIPAHETLTEPEVTEARGLGLGVLPWTVNNPDDMQRLIGWGANGLITDRPDLALQLHSPGNRRSWR